MIRPSDNVLRAIVALEGNTFWKEIVGWIETSLITQSLANNKATGEATVKMQGRNLELQDIMTNIKDARRFQENAREAKRMEQQGG
jgi:hypothetical protein